MTIRASEMGARGPKPKHLDISCPNGLCKKYGVCGDCNVISNGTYRTLGGEVRKYICRECGRVFNSRTGTAYEGIHRSHDKFDLVADCISNGVSVRRTAKIAKCSTSTVVRWTKKAGRHAGRVADRIEGDLRPEVVQMDEMTYTLKKNAT